MTKSAAIRTIKSRFDSTCPQCKTPMPIGSEIGVTQDKVWRCMRCTRMFDEMFRETGPDRDCRGRRIYFENEAAIKAFDAKRKAIREKYGFTDEDFRMVIPPRA